MIFDKETLERMYREGKLPWDYGKPCEQLVDFANKQKSCRALDLGCGTGTDAVFLAQKGFNVSAIDISEEAIKIAKLKALKAGVKIDFIVGDVLEMPFEDQTFEFVNDNGCFHQLAESSWKRFIEELFRVMRPKAKYLMKCFSDKEPPNPKLPNRLSEETIRKYFSENFNILYIKPTVFEARLQADHKGYSCLMERK
jgi:ubiquinone/menaquinone biosynthesis C-methylase UbiE